MLKRISQLLLLLSMLQIYAQDDPLRAATERPSSGIVQIGKHLVVLRHYPGTHNYVVDIVPQKNEKVKIGKVVVNLRRPDGVEKVYYGKEVFDGVWKAYCEYAVTAPDGEWKFDISIYNEKGVLLASNKDAFNVRKQSWPWENLKLGISDDVIPPFTPLRVDGNRVSCVLRDYTFNEMGLWNQVESMGKKLLAHPMEVSCIIDGNESTLRGGVMKIVEESPNRVRIRTSANTNGLIWKAVSTVDYDGFVWTSVTLNSKHEISIDKLRIHIPMKAQEATLMHAVSNSIRHNKAGYVPEGNGEVWNSKDIAKRPLRGRELLDTDLLPYLWIGGEERGICWLVDCEKGFNLRKGEASVRVKRVPGEKIILAEIDIINETTKIKGERSFEFGLQATPVKPMPKDWKNWYFNFGRDYINGMRHISFGLHPYGNGTNIFGSKYPPYRDYSFIKALKRMTQTKRAEPDAAQNWLDKTSSHFKAYIQSNLNYFRRHRRHVDMTDDEIIQSRFGSLRHFLDISVQVAANTDHLIPYTDPRVLYVDKPEYQYYAAEWWSPQGRWSGVTRVFPTKSLVDFLLYNYREMIINGFDGIYLDDVYILPGDNPDAGSAEIDAEGNVFPRMGLLAMRELIKRMAVMQYQMGISPRMTVLHMTNAFLIPTFAFADVAFDWEMLFGYTDFQKRFPLDFIRTESIGRQAGLIPTVASGIRNRNGIEQKEEWRLLCEQLTRSLMGLTLLHEIKLSQMSNQNVDFAFVHRVYALLNRFGAAEAGTTFVPYWINDKRVNVLNEQFKVSHYKKQGSLLLIILNTGDKSVAEIELDCKALEISDKSVVLDLDNQALLNGYPIEVLVGERDFKLIFIGSQTDALALFAEEIFVDPVAGNDANPGTRQAPLRRFPVALARAKPGDIIRMMPVDAPLRINFPVRDKSGAPDKPIVIDGGFNTYTGVAPVQENQWQMVEPGLYKRVRENVAQSMLMRYFMCFNGEMNRMGRPGSKWRGGGADLKKAEELKEYEWTIVDDTDFYFRIPADKTPAECRVEEPVLSSGVQLSGESSHLVFRNMIVKNFWNDGYNIHGNCHDILFENVAAFYNGEDGISAQGTCRITVRNFIAIGNSTGICHINESEGIHENVYIAETAARDLFMINRRNIFRNVAIEGKSPGGIEFTYGGKGSEVLSENHLEQCFFHSLTPDGRLVFSPKSKVTAQAVASHGYRHRQLPDNWQIVDEPENIEKQIAELKDQLLAIFGDML